MYVKDKVTRITLRLNENQFNFVKDTSDKLGVSPSEFLRMVVNATMTSTKEAENKLKEGSGRENDNATVNNLV